MKSLNKVQKLRPATPLEEQFYFEQIQIATDAANKPATPFDKQALIKVIDRTANLLNNIGYERQGSTVYLKVEDEPLDFELTRIMQINFEQDCNRVEHIRQKAMRGTPNA